MEALKRQYEQFPYPVYPLLANVRQIDTYSLNYRAGVYACFGSTFYAKPIPRILVVGCGTFEPYPVALANPEAKITALDISNASLRQLKRRLAFHRLSRQVELVQGDFLEMTSDELGRFDYIIATGVIHHIPDRDKVIRRLEQLLEPMGILRLMVYSANGRRRIYDVQNFARILGVTKPAELRRHIDLLPADHPIRIQFYMYQDCRSDAGVVDGFLHAYDRPFEFAELEQTLDSSGLLATKFLHQEIDEFSEVDKRLKHRTERSDPEKVQILDGLNLLEKNYTFFAAREKEVRQCAPVETDLYEPNPIIKKAVQSRQNILMRSIPLIVKMGNEQMTIRRKHYDALSNRLEADELRKHVPGKYERKYCDKLLLLKAGRKRGPRGG